MQKIIHVQLEEFWYAKNYWDIIENISLVQNKVGGLADLLSHMDEAYDSCSNVMVFKTWLLSFEVPHRQSSGAFY